MPPEAATVNAPLEPPLQATLVVEEVLVVIAVACVIVTLELALQPLLSVTVTVYVPAAKLLAVAPVALLLQA